MLLFSECHIAYFREPGSADDPIGLMRAQFSNLRRVEMMPEAGLLVQLERSEAVSSILLGFSRNQSRVSSIGKLYQPTFRCWPNITSA